MSDDTPIARFGFELLVVVSLIQAEIDWTTYATTGTKGYRIERLADEPPKLEFPDLVTQRMGDQ